jgi:hypothetical protein
VDRDVLVVPRLPSLLVEVWSSELGIAGVESTSEAVTVPQFVRRGVAVEFILEPGGVIVLDDARPGGAVRELQVEKFRVLLS